MTLQQEIAAPARRQELAGMEADPELLATCLAAQGEAAVLASLLEEALLTGSPGERRLAREYDAALDEALRHDPAAEWQDEMFCNCDEEARGEAWDSLDL